MAIAASEAYDAGAAIVHVHFRDQRPGKGHLPTWDPNVAKAISEAIRAARPVQNTAVIIGANLFAGYYC
jgi:3-keto-5-aminohexanoate cleavage enzyme